MVQGAKTPPTEAGNAGVVEIAAEKHIAATLKNLLAEGDPVENLIDRIASGEINPEANVEYRRALALLTDSIPVEQAISTLNEYADNGLLSGNMHMALVDMFVERQMEAKPADVAVEKKDEPKKFEAFLEEARPLAKLESPHIEAEEKLQREFAKHPDFAQLRTDIGVIILQKAFEDSPTARKKASAEMRIAKVLMGESQKHLLQNLFTVAECVHRTNGFKMGGKWGPVPSVLNMDHLQMEARANLADITKNIADETEKQTFRRAVHGLEQFLSSRNNVEERIKVRIALDWKRDEIQNMARELPEDIKRRSEAPHARENFIAQTEQRIAKHEHNMFELLEDTLSSDAMLLQQNAHTKLERALVLSEFVQNVREEIAAVKNGTKNPFEANLEPVDLTATKQKALAHEVEAKNYADSAEQLRAIKPTGLKQKAKLTEKITHAERLMREHRERAEQLHGNLRLVSLLDEDEKELRI